MPEPWLREPWLQEPWLRETVLPCDPAIAAVLFALEQAEEDLARFVPPRSAYFHLRHIAGSLDRLTTYLEGRELTERQLFDLQNESNDDGAPFEILLETCRHTFAITREALLALKPEEFDQARYVGRRRIRTTAIGLAIHMAEHTQRHVGQIIAYSRVG